MTQTAIDLLKTQRDARKQDAERLATELSPVIQQGERAAERVKAAYRGVDELTAAIAALEKDQRAQEVPEEPQRSPLDHTQAQE